MRKKESFTIIEILITMLIMGTLSSTLIPRIGDAREEAKQTMTKVDKSRELASEVDFDGYTFSSDSAGGGASYSDLLPNGWEDITVCDPNDSTKCITMMDRNLGATKAGTTCSSKDTGACGNHYQRGNNYGFANPGVNNSAAFPGGETMTTDERVDTRNYGPQNYFDRAVFSKITYNPYDWSTKRNDNLRGGANDNQSNNRGFDETNNKATNVGNRRGPCVDGYHVPSIGEWNQVLEYWAEENDLELKDMEGLKYSYKRNGLKFQKDFKIPFAGRRDNNANGSQIGYNAGLWSSSPYIGNDFARRFSLNPDEAMTDLGNYRAYAYSLRCFKD